MAKIAIVMGSTSDWPTMQNAAVMLKQFGVEFEAQVVSAHRRLDPHGRMQQLWQRCSWVCFRSSGGAGWRRSKGRGD